MNRKAPDAFDQTQRIRLIRQVRFYQMVSLVLVIAALVLARLWQQHRSTAVDEPGFGDRYDPSAPQADAIKPIVSPLRYSFMPVLHRSSVRLDIDVKNDLWRLRNIHLYDEKGNLLLEEGRYGLCGDLAAHTFSRIRPILEADYLIRFVRATESSYFPAPLNTHYVLSIIDQRNPERVYILDPTFRRYGPLQSFDDYLFFEHLPTLRFMDRRETDHIEIVNRAVPVLIERNVKLSLIVMLENGRFDGSNFSIGILSTLRNTYMPRTVYKVGVRNGIRFREEKPAEARLLAGFPEYEQLKSRADQFLDGILMTN